MPGFCFLMSVGATCFRALDSAPAGGGAARRGIEDFGDMVNALPSSKPISPCETFKIYLEGEDPRGLRRAGF